MIYETDTDAVRDAKDEVDDIKLEIQIHEIDKQIDDINEQIESLEKYYDDLIESTERMYNAQIDALQGIKDQWESIAEMADMQKALGLLDSFGISMQDILSGNTDVLSKFKDKYLDVANAINNYEITGATDNLATGFDEATNSANKLSDAISGTGSSSGSTGNSEQSESSASGSSTSLKSAIDDQTKDAVEKIGEQANAFSGDEESLKSAVQEVIKTIGTVEQESEGGSGDGTSQESESAETLRGAIKSQYDLANEVIPQEALIFDELKISITNCVTELQNMITALETLSSTGVPAVTGATTGTNNISVSGKSTGGVITKKDASPLDYIAKAIGEDHLVALKEGEIVLNKAQQDKFLLNNVLNPVAMGLDIKTPNLSHLKNNNKTQNIINGGVNVTCPNVTDAEIAKRVGGEIEKAFFGMNNYANQRTSVTR